MKNNKTAKLYRAAVGIATLATAPSLFASISGTGAVTVNYDYGNDLTSLSATPSSGDTLANTSLFYSFCLNPGVLINTPGTYTYTLSDSAVPGGPGAITTPNPIAIGTAWLYSQYRAGTLAGYVNDAADNTALQQAIWWLEGATGGVNNGFVTTAEAGLGGLTDAQVRGAAPSDDYGVVALNLTSADGTEVQPFLGEVNGREPSVPEPGTLAAGALLLLPFSLSTVRILRRRQLIETV